MNIVFELKNALNYKDLQVGDVFVYDGCAYMRTDQQEDDFEGEYKSVNLGTGTMEVFGLKVPVVKYPNVTCTLE